MNSKSPIGVFDSGMGGLSVAAEIRRQLPEEKIIFFGDSARNPYGTKSKEEIASCSMEIAKHLESRGIKALVIACNTATSAAAPLLRSTFDFDIIGMEPALKVAADKKPGGKIAVWATKLTLEEEKFARLMHRFDSDHEIRRIPCPKLVRLVEEGKLGQTELVDQVLKEYLEQSRFEDLDSIVLGCTHFIFFKERLKELTEGKIDIVDGNEGTVRHLGQLLEQKDLLSSGPGGIEMENSDPDKLDLSWNLYESLEVSDESEPKRLADIQR